MALTPNSNISSGASPATSSDSSRSRQGMNGLQPRSPNPNHSRQIFASPFDSSMFLIDSTVRDSVSQPLQPALSIPSASQNGSNSNTFHYTPSPANTCATPDCGSNYDSAHLEPRVSLPPSSLDMMTGISGSTTPGYEPLAHELSNLPNFYESFSRTNSLTTPTVNVTDEVELETDNNPTAPSRYPPSPCMTVSPQPGHAWPQVTISRATTDKSRSNQNIGDSSPDVVRSPYSHQQSSSSSSSGLAGENITIRRGDDGEWRGGISPSIRTKEHVELSLKDMEFEMAKEEKKREVEDWLQRSSEQLPRQNTPGRLSAPGGNARERRPVSVSDFRTSPMYADGEALDPIQTGIGSNSTTDDDYESEDDSSVVSKDSAWRAGSLDEPINIEKEFSASDEELREANGKEEDPELKRRETDPEFEPKSKQFFSAHPWVDPKVPVTRGASCSHKNQPETANKAIMRFHKRAENFDTASRVATFGSNMTMGRRNSSGDANAVLPDPFKGMTIGKERIKNGGASTPRRPSIWGSVTSGLKRGLSNAGDKEKNQEKPQSDESLSPIDTRPRRGASVSSSNGSPFAASILGPAFASTTQTNSGRSLTDALKSINRPLMATGAGAGGGSSAGFRSRIGIKRSRSRSDLGAHIFGVASMMVGPAMPIASPSPPADDPAPGKLKSRFTFGEEARKRGTEQAKRMQMHSPDHTNRNAPDEDEEMEEPDFSPGSTCTRGRTKVPLLKHDIVPTFDGFAENVRSEWPTLHKRLVERIAHEQVKRYKKLVDHRHKHLKALSEKGSCSNGIKCRKTIGAIGVGSDGIVGVTGHRRGNSNFDGEDHGSDSASEAGDQTSPNDGNIAAAQFPEGVPTPPVSRLPAEFECPICFKTKKFNKPSDWTKHVHEDVQPFTCTFPECPEPKSFKRKADWVRHENERHRHLEWWHCNQPDCAHTCYRKDNFVQHLVREHKMQEPKSAKTSARSDVWNIVDACHKETEKSPTSEKCRFCNASCSSWKKLTVHLAQHMEKLSLPVLDLIRDDAVVIGSTGSPNSNINGQRVRDTSVQIPTYQVSPPLPPPPPQQQPQPQMHQRSHSQGTYGDFVAPVEQEYLYTHPHQHQHQQHQHPQHQHQHPQQHLQQQQQQQVSFDGAFYEFPQQQQQQWGQQPMGINMSMSMGMSMGAGVGVGGMMMSTGSYGQLYEPGTEEFAYGV